LALNGTVAAQGQERAPDTPSNPRRLTADPCNKVYRWSITSNVTQYRALDRSRVATSGLAIRMSTARHTGHQQQNLALRRDDASDVARSL
jgi:hypothetical protein